MTRLPIFGAGKARDKSCTSDRTRTYWTPPMDRYLIDLLLDQALKGNKLGQTFITQAWTIMVAHFNANFQSNYEKDILKNRYKYLRKQFNEIRNILKQDGFLWDEAREMITADDQLWDAYIKVNLMLIISDCLFCYAVSYVHNYRNTLMLDLIESEQSQAITNCV